MVGSREGMIRSAFTSEMLKERVKTFHVKLNDFLESIEQRDYQKFFKIIMNDSDNLHDICGDSKPPI